ncbi:unnamed protein product [Gordionus sp. m RMFG-2023]
MKHLNYYKISELTGFAMENPLTRIHGCEEWMGVAENLSDILNKKTLNNIIERLPQFDIRTLSSYKELRLARVVLTTLAQGLIWEDLQINGYAEHIPKNLAIPLYDISYHLGMKPIQTYSDTCLFNYRINEQHSPLHMSNCELIFKMENSDDYKWFFLISLQAEFDFAKYGLKPLIQIKKAINESMGSKETFTTNIESLSKALRVMSFTINDMMKHVDPDVFYEKVRPFMMGWGTIGDSKPNEKKIGIILDGISEFPYNLYGPSAVESSIIPSYDQILGIKHDNERSKYLMAIREYMPLEHRMFLEDLSEESNLRTFIDENGYDEKDPIVLAYNEAVRALGEFRSIHLKLASRYIMIPGTKRKIKNIGTAGSGNDAVFFGYSIEKIFRYKKIS